MRKCRYRKQVVCNIRKDRPLIRNLRTTLTAASFLVVAFIGTLLSLSSSYRSLEELLLPLRNVYCTFRELSDISAINADIPPENGVTDVEISAYAFMHPRGMELPYPELTDTNIGDCFLLIDGEEHRGEPTSPRQAPMWMKALVLPDDTAFPDSLVRYHSYPAEMLSAGTMISGSGQIVMSSAILSRFGLSDIEQTELLGRRISLGITAAGESRICLRDMELTGIISEDYAASKMPVFSHIWFACDSENEDILYQAELGMSSPERFCVTMYTADFRDCRRLRSALTGAGCTNCGYDSAADTAVLLGDITTLAGRAFSLLIVFFALILAVSFAGSMILFSENSAENYRMLTLLGVEHRDIRAIIRGELFAVFSRSYLYCALLSAAYFSGLPLILKRIMEAQLTIAPTAAEMSCSLICGTLIFAAGYGASYLYIRGKVR